MVWSFTPRTTTQFSLMGDRPARSAASDALQRRAYAEASPVHGAKHFVVQAVQAHRHAPQPGLGERLGVPPEQVGVGRQRQVLDRQPRQHGHEAWQVRPQQRLPAGQSNLPDAKLDEDAGQPRNLLEGEDLGLRQEGVVLAVDLGRHAIGTAEIAPVRHGNAQIAQRTAKRVDGRRGDSGRHAGDDSPIRLHPEFTQWAATIRVMYRERPATI